VAVVAILLVVSVPVFGDMTNYTTDSRMLDGGPVAVGVVRVAAASGGGTGIQSPRPWLSYKPSGAGSVETADLPAPWKNTSSATETVDVYTPPGYDPAGHRRYPVLYEAEYPYDLWDTGMNIGVVLDTLIDEGTIPPMIVVFVSDVGAPFVDSECANSTNGVEWMDKFISKTVVSYVDENYLTIAQADARASIGFSEGGYCAAILALRHPTVFATSIPVSGYFWAGDGGSGSALPFAGSASALADASPMIVATHLPAAQRAKLYFIVVADPGQPLYGDEATAFEHLLKVEGYPVVALNSDLPHGWDQLRRELPAALETWAAHLVAAGVSGRA
jgi:enterochelin esterase-like enzyme